MSNKFWKRLISFLLIFTINFVHLATPALVLAEELSSPQPTETPTPSSTPTPSEEPSPSPSPTPEPSAVPTPTPNPSEEATPSATPTLSPAPTPEATSSAQPAVQPENSQKRDINKLLRPSDKKTHKVKSKNGDYAEGEALVKFKKDKINLNSLIDKPKEWLFEKRNNIEVIDEIKDANIKVVKSDKNTKDLVEQLKKDSSVAIVEPNYILKLTSVPNDPKFGDLWAMQNSGQTVNGVTGKFDADIDAPEAWDLEKADQQDVVVAVLDTGVDYNHPDLIANLWDGNNCKSDIGIPITGGCPNHGWNVDNNDDDPYDGYGHGTHVSGTIAGVANDNTGIVGTSIHNNIKIMAVKVFLGSAGETYTSTVIKGINFAKHNEAKVINASFRTYDYSQLMKDAIDAFPGLFIAAAGNEAKNIDSYPAYPAGFNSPNIIAIAATDQNDEIASFSNYGATTVDVGAPGVNILSSLPGNITESTYEEKDLQDFVDVTPPAIPNGYTKTGDWGTKILTDSGNTSGGGGLGAVLYGDVNNVPYKNNADNVFTSPKFNLSGYDSGLMTFLSRCDTEYKTNYTDYVQLEISKDGENFQYLDKWDEYDLDSLSGDYLHDTTGSAQAYLEIDIPKEYANSDFRYRLIWHTNGSETGDLGLGCFVDYISIYGGKVVSTSGNYNYWGGTSMATPHVVGEAAMIESYNPTLSASQVKDIILNSGDPIPALNGKTVSGKRINLYNALVQAGQTPQPSPTPSPTPTPTPSPSATPSPTPTPTPSPSPIPSPSPTPTPTPSPTPIPNNPPVASNVEVTTSEDTAITFNMSVTDADNNALNYVIVNQPAHGQLEFNVGVGKLPNGGGITSPTVIYTPDANFNGTDEFTYKGNDGISDSNIAKATITVTAVNDTPVAKNLSLSTNEDTGLKVVMEGNDVDGDSLSYITLASPSHGQLIFPSGNLVMYLPDLNYNGPDSFTYKVNDGKLDSNVATVNISVLAVNDAPVALDGKVTTDEDIPVNFNLLSTDTENNNLVYTILSNPAKGTITYLSGTEFTYTPNKDQNGTDSLTFKVNDGSLDSNTATFTFTINPVNDAPVADDFLVTTNEDTIFPVIFAEKDIDGDILYHTIVSQPAHGQLVNPGNNAIKYVPDANYFGADSFTYQLKDENLDSNIATVNITVNPVNDAPNIIGINLTPVNPKTNSILSAESSADDIEGDPITFKYQWKKNKEDLKEETQTSLDLSKAGNGDKGDKISVTVISSDGQDSSSKTSDEVTIGNTAPVAAADTLLTTQNNALTFKAYVLSGNDTDLDTKDKLEVTAVASLIHGTAALKDGNITFTPEEGYIGNANLIYTVSDGSEEAVGSLTINIIEPLNSGKTIIAPVVNVEPEKPQIVIGNTNVDSVINVPSTVNNASLDTTNVLTISGQTKEAAIPNNISVNTESSLGTLSIAIPAGITVSGPNNWNGNITLPNLLSSSSVTPPATPGTTVQTTGVIEIGAGDTPLSLSKAVRLVIPGKAGQLTGFTRGVTFTAINTICTGDSQTAGDSLGEGADCKIDSGSDLVIWTKHFTKFITYTQTNNPASGGTGSGTSANSGSGSNNGSANAPLCSDAKPGSAPTLVSAKAGENMVTLTWNKAQDPVTYYLVAYGAEKGKIKFGNPNVGDKNTLSYTVKNLSGGVTYYFKVRAGNNCMPGDFSNELAATPYGSLITGSAEGFEAGVLGEIPDSTPSAVLEASKNVTEGSKEANKSSSRWLILAGIFLGMLTLGVGLRKLRGKKLAPKKIVARSRKFTSRKKR